MKIRFSQRFSHKNVEFCLWLLLFGISTYILYGYVNGFFVANTQGLITGIALFIILIGILAFHDLAMTLTICLGVIHFLLLVVWGNIVPFIQLFPFAVAFLLSVSRKISWVGYYLGVTLLFTIVEIISITPLLKSEIIEVGLPNLTILFFFQLFTFAACWLVLRFYTLFDDIDALGLNSLTTTTSVGFLRSTVAKGLFLSILLHLFNNLLQTLLWKGAVSARQQQIIQLLGESTRVENSTKNYTLIDVLELLDLVTQENIAKVPLSISDAKLLFILLFSISHNYRKQGNEFTFSCARVANHRWQFIWQNTARADRTTAHVWSRNLGSIKQFLQMTGKGSIRIERGKGFRTVVELSTQQV